MTTKNILFFTMGSPYESDLTTSLFRLVEAALAQNHEVVVWACAGATALTMETLGARKPRNFLSLGTHYPSTAALVKAMLVNSDGRLKWYICRHCMEERGATRQIAQVKVQPPFRFFRYLEQADVCLAMK